MRWLRARVRAVAPLLLGMLVAATHYGYNFLPEGAAQKSCFYVARGIEATAAFLLLARKLTPGSLGVLVCWWAAAEEAQTAACGILTAPEIVVPAWSGLCVQAFGAWGYAAFGAAIVVYWWSHGHKNRISTVGGWSDGYRAALSRLRAGVLLRGCRRMVGAFRNAVRKWA